LDEKLGAVEELIARCSISERRCIADEVPLPLPLLMTKGMRLETRR
jgi:hypothetical protein